MSGTALTGLVPSVCVGAHPQVALFGLPFATGPAAATLRLARSAVDGAPRMLVTANIDHVLSLSRDPAFRQAYAWAAARTLDGMPLAWLARRRGAGAAHRVTGHDLLDAFAREQPAAAERIFLMASNAAVAAGAARRLLQAGYTGPQITSAIPPFGFERDARQSAQLLLRIREHGTTVLLMGVGAPKSEIWAYRHRDALGSALILCVGDALAVCAGQVPRAPAGVQRAGMEWLWRFALSPRRLFYRYFIRSLRFPWLALRNPDLSVI